LDAIARMVACEKAFSRKRIAEITRGQWREAKRLSLSDRSPAPFPVPDGARPASLVAGEWGVRARPRALGVEPVFKTIDTCAAEFEAETPYFYSTYEDENESHRTERPKVVILGGGPNRIGQGIEFDYCCVHACYALTEAGFETIMVNCNPETVSTDYDTSDRLFLEPLTAEDVLEIARVEQSKGTLLGVIVQLGGQTPLKLAAPL